MKFWLQWESAEYPGQEFEAATIEELLELARRERERPRVAEGLVLSVHDAPPGYEALITVYDAFTE